MRNFRNAHTNLSDVRIAYTYLIALALALSIMGLIASGLDNKLSENELISYRNTLSECSDSLREYIDTDAPERKLSAALRFENAVAALTCTDNARKELIGLADKLKNGVFEKDMLAVRTELRGLSDTFSMLSLLEYDDRTSAAERISSEISRLVGADEVIDTEDTVVDEQVSNGSIDRFTLSTAKNNAVRLIGDAAQSLTFKRCGGCYQAETENLSMQFSTYDGSPVGMFYLRLGVIPDAYFTQKELVGYVQRLIANLFFDGEPTELDIADVRSMCGYTMIKLSTESDIIKAAIDEHGRLCALEYTEAGDL